MTVTCHDWRTCAADEATLLLEREAEAWRRELDWDVRHSWRVIEPARAAGVLPGFVARDAHGRITGWTWFLVNHGCLQVAALVATDRRVVRTLVDAIMFSPEAQAIQSSVWSVRGTPPGLVEALGAYGLAVAPYAYQVATLTNVETPAPAGRTWQPRDLDRAVTLCARAYSADRDVRPFAPNGTTAEWREYLEGLIGTDGCGTFQRSASFVIDGPAQTLAAGIICSLIDRDVAHISQVIVDPDFRGQGFGRGLMRAAMREAAAIGARRMTLLVATDNRPARALYAQVGFRDHATFLVASSVQPRRSTSVALATGGVNTLR
jgi:ribosomal protein S18 acetylase RimI-like enzyme